MGGFRHRPVMPKDTTSIWVGHERCMPKRWYMMGWDENRINPHIWEKETSNCSSFLLDKLLNWSNFLLNCSSLYLLPLNSSILFIYNLPLTQLLPTQWQQLLSLADLVWGRIPRTDGIKYLYRLLGLPRGLLSQVDDWKTDLCIYNLLFWSKTVKNEHNFIFYMKNWCSSL